jgi:hypothetical protein
MPVYGEELAEASTKCRQGLQVPLAEVVPTVTMPLIVDQYFRNRTLWHRNCFVLAQQFTSRESLVGCLSCIRSIELASRLP